MDAYGPIVPAGNKGLAVSGPTRPISTFGVRMLVPNLGAMCCFPDAYPAEVVGYGNPRPVRGPC
jgi:hypothetical protein